MAKAVYKKKLVNHVVFILDCSGSMENVKEQARTNFNEQLQTIKKNSKGQETNITLIRFSSSAQVVFQDKPCKIVKELTEYNCGGMTALYDAIGLGLEGLRGIKPLMYGNSSRTFSHAALVVVITDGFENNSKEYKGAEGLEKLRKEIKRLEEKGNFTFTFMGGNLDVVNNIQAAFNLSVGNTVVFDTGSFDGQFKGSCAVNTGLSNYFSSRSGGLTNVTTFYSNTTDEEDKK